MYDRTHSAQEFSSREQAVQGRQQIAGLETLACMCIDSADTYKISRAMRT